MSPSTESPRAALARVIALRAKELGITPDELVGSMPLRDVGEDALNLLRRAREDTSAGQGGHETPTTSTDTDDCLVIGEVRDFESGDLAEDRYDHIFACDRCIAKLVHVKVSPNGVQAAVDMIRRFLAPLAHEMEPPSMSGRSAPPSDTLEGSDVRNDHSRESDGFSSWFVGVRLHVPEWSAHGGATDDDIFTLQTREYARAPIPL